MRRSSKDGRIARASERYACAPRHRRRTLARAGGAHARVPYEARGCEARAAEPPHPGAVAGGACGTTMPHLAPCVLAPWPRRTECSDAFRCAAGVCWIGVEAHLRRAASGVVVVCGVWASCAGVPACRTNAAASPGIFRAHWSAWKGFGACGEV